MTRAAYIVEAVRTPVGRHGAALAGVRPDDLAALAVGELVRRVPSLDPQRIDDVYLGAANGAGEDNRNVARMAILLAGLPVSIPGATVNRLCGSGLEAVVEAARAVMVGDADIVVAGGVESMTRAPWVMPKPDRGYSRDNATMFSTALGWRMVNPRMPSQWTVALGEGAEILAERFEISREEQDAFAVRSHHGAAAAWDACRFRDETVPVTDASGRVLLERDEGVRADTTVEKLGALRPVIRADGTVTAGNASPLNDGAAALLVCSEAAAAELGREPMARLAGVGVGGVEPHLYGIGPVEAVPRALRRAGIGWGELALVELNEAFAAQALACLRHWPDCDSATVNVNGGAIAIGHPLGASGARILTTLVHELRRRGGGHGLATMCIGVGQGIAVVVEA